MRQAARHFHEHDADYYLILAGDHLYRMDYARWSTPTSSSAPTSPSRPSRWIPTPRRRWASSASTATARSSPSRRSRSRRASGDRTQHSRGRDVRARTATSSRSWRRWASMCSRGGSCSTCSNAKPGIDFGRELIPGALGTYKVKPYLYRGYWADVGTIESFYDANVMLGRPGAPFRFWDPQRPIYTHLRHLPGVAADRLPRQRLRSSTTAALSIACHVNDSVVGIRTRIAGRRAQISALGAARRRLLRGRRAADGCRRSASAAMSCSIA